MPQAAHGADGGGGIPSQHVRRNGSPHVALHGRLSHQARGLGEAKGKGNAISFVELGSLLKNAGKNLVGEVVDLHWIRPSKWCVVWSRWAGRREMMFFFFRWVKGRQTKGGKVGQGGWLWGLYITRQDDTERPFQAQ